ncbi:DUF2799 domain-containing protein [Tateyamaria omphalii]|uniref:DUF2799 domain-containing protein n=1 Tax=Tateyamaria omphalii TaxID=299262 RepID=UPI001C99171C|nr:DUF2799 domain-containing protein [Tateyamaria omphalii]MBY5931970.1 DUF2799 domain-containing protein [Tateyamaria omphalii]
MHLRVLLLPSLIVTLTSCAEITDLHCANINWYNFGYQTGLDGKPSSVITSEAGICRASAAAPREDLALQGYRAGLENYCTPTNAFRIGQRGGALSSFCAPEKLSLMRQPHQNGLQDRRLSRQIRELETERDRLRDQRDRIDIDEDRRAEIRRDIRALERRIDRLEDRRLLLSLVN